MPSCCSKPRPRTPRTLLSLVIGKLDVGEFVRRSANSFASHTSEGSRTAMRQFDTRVKNRSRKHGPGRLPRHSRIWQHANSTAGTHLGELSAIIGPASSLNRSFILGHHGPSVSTAKDCDSLSNGVEHVSSLREWHKHLSRGSQRDCSTLRQEFEQLHQARPWSGCALVRRHRSSFCEESGVPSLGSSCTSRQQLGDGGDRNGCRDSLPLVAKTLPKERRRLNRSRPPRRSGLHVSVH